MEIDNQRYEMVLNTKELGPVGEETKIYRVDIIVLDKKTNKEKVVMRHPFKNGLTHDEYMDLRLKDIFSPDAGERITDREVETLMRKGIFPKPIKLKALKGGVK